MRLSGAIYSQPIAKFPENSRQKNLGTDFSRRLVLSDFRKILTGVFTTNNTRPRKPHTPPHTPRPCAWPWPMVPTTAPGLPMMPPPGGLRRGKGLDAIPTCRASTRPPPALPDHAWLVVGFPSWHTGLPRHTPGLPNSRRWLDGDPAAEIGRLQILRARGDNQAKRKWQAPRRLWGALMGINKKRPERRMDTR